MEIIGGRFEQGVNSFDTAANRVGRERNWFW